MNVESIFSGDDQVMLKRDTHREDEIKSIKTAWEELQPGRAAKVTPVPNPFPGYRSRHRPHPLPSYHTRPKNRTAVLGSRYHPDPIIVHLFSFPTHAHQL